MASASTSVSTMPPGGLVQQEPELLKIEPEVLSRWILGFRCAIVIGFILVIASLPILTHMYSIERDHISTRMLGPVFFSVGIYLLVVGALFEKVLRGYKEYMITQNVSVGDSNVGAYVRSSELFRRPSLVIHPPPATNRGVISLARLPSEESNFIEIVEPYASFSNMGIPPPPYRP